MLKTGRTLGIVLCFAFITSILTGCGGADRKPVTIRFMWWGDDNRHKATHATIDLYKKAFPNVTIEPEYSGWKDYGNKLKTQLAGGTAPDLFQVPLNLVSELQVNGGYFTDLAKYPTLIDLSMFSASILDSFCKVKGQTIATPAGLSGWTYFVNKNTLAKAGIPLGQKWTWDRLIDAAKKVHALGKDYYLLDWAPGWEKLVQPYLAALTGVNPVAPDFSVTFTREDLIKALTVLKQLNDAPAWPPVDEVSAYETTDQNPRWMDGHIGGTITEYVSTILAMANAIGDAAAVEAFPTLEGGKDSAIFISPPFCFSLNAKSTRIEPAVRFLNYIYTNEEAITTLKDCRGVPPSKKGLEVAKSTGFVTPLVMQATPAAVADKLMAGFAARLAEMKAAQ